uniref:Endosome-associated-trafficking regulator 1 n=1 Tax=Aquila chrysaetos chrysaetos TaxID=223781 RepID=A0A663EW12_AQUCH
AGPALRRGPAPRSVVARVAERAEAGRSWRRVRVRPSPTPSPSASSSAARRGAARRRAVLTRRRGPARALAPSYSRIRRRPERRRTTRRRNGAGATSPWSWSRPTSPSRAPPRPPPAPSSARARGWQAARTRAWPASEPPPGPGFHSLRQPSYEELKEENASLRSKINKLQIFSETQADKMRKLEKKLEENKIKEEKEAQDLEAMVQHVEQNLQLMTVQLKNYKTENEALRSGQSASLAVVKQNADLALQNLLTVITNSRSLIKQLVSGAESLQLVADLLKSIDRISEVSEDGQ